MNEKIYTQADLVSMPHDEFQGFQMLLRARAYKLMGFHWKEFISVQQDFITGTIVFTWK